MKKKLMSWDQLKKKDFEAILGEYTFELEKNKAQFKGAFGALKTDIPGIKNTSRLHKKEL